MVQRATALALIAIVAIACATSVCGEYEPPPKPEGAYLLETFQGKLKDLEWIASENDKYEGEFKISAGSKTFLEGDTGLYVPEKAMHYAIARAVDVPSSDDKDFVLQYQLRYDDFPTCGGSYLKLVKAPFAKLEEWDNNVPYSIMFGPDKCGPTAVVHLIIQQENKKSGKLVEHHLKGPPRPLADRDNHLYTVAIYRNQSFALLVDNEVERVGSLLEDFDPPFQPPEEIDDPEDEKPSDWVDEMEIPDPEATKPDDWDEDAPMKINDPDATKPPAWVDDEPQSIPDPDAKKPENWDDEDDGEWEAPMIPNPKCEEAGCGAWTPPTIANPAYKGKWTPPMIANPEYKGEWKPKQIPNPEYYKVDKVTVLPISAVGIEIWTMDKGYMFDNIILCDSLEQAQKFAKETFGAITEVQSKMKEEDIDEMAAKKSFYGDDDAPPDVSGEDDDYEDDDGAGTILEDEEEEDKEEEEEEEKVDL